MNVRVQVAQQSSDSSRIQGVALLDVSLELHGLIECDEHDAQRISSSLLEEGEKVIEGCVRAVGEIFEDVARGRQCFVEAYGVKRGLE